jgi:hypothetical protein
LSAVLPTVPDPAPGPPTSLPPEIRRWLHDKYERLAAEEGQLAASRTSYFAAIGTVLITAFVVVLNYFLNQHFLLDTVVSFLAALGILISLVWAILLHRTVDAQRLWRDAARQLERDAPPVDGSLPGTASLRSGAVLQIDLLKPYTAHAKRFGRDSAISWMDRLSPDTLTEVLPVTFLVIWALILGGIWLLAPP